MHLLVNCFPNPKNALQSKISCKLWCTWDYVHLRTSMHLANFTRRICCKLHTYRDSLAGVLRVMYRVVWFNQHCILMRVLNFFWFHSSFWLLPFDCLGLSTQLWKLWINYFSSFLFYGLLVWISILKRILLETVGMLWKVANSMLNIMGGPWSNGDCNMCH